MNEKIKSLIAILCFLIKDDMMWQLIILSDYFYDLSYTGHKVKQSIFYNLAYMTDLIIWHIFMGQRKPLINK